MTGRVSAHVAIQLLLLLSACSRRCLDFVWSRCNVAGSATALELMTHDPTRPVEGIYVREKREWWFYKKKRKKTTHVFKYRHECEPVHPMLIMVFHDAV